MGSAVGTIRKIVIAGITYDVAADSNFTFNRNKFEKEGQATTGKNLIKRTKRVQTVEGELSLTPQDMESLNTAANSLADQTLAIELADGSVYKATGEVNFESYETDSGKGKITLIPRRDWTPFLAD